MINKLSIRNFKSIRVLDLDCRRVNVFIGEPNAGKTNVLEALSLECSNVWDSLKKVCRVERFIDLVRDQDDSNKIEIHINGKVITAELLNKQTRLRLDWNRGEPYILNSEFAVIINQDDTPSFFAPTIEQKKNEYIMNGTDYYLFDPQAPHDDLSNERLEPPFGQNLAALMAGDKKSRQLLSSFFPVSRYRPTIDKSQNTVLMAHEEDGTLVTLPYQSASETLRRMLFYTLAVQTNHNATLLFDEPEAHSFPPYTKTLAERIALDDRGNQFFLTTHSPYMLDSLLSKTPASELNVVLCRMENFETKIYPLNQEQIDQIKEWSMDAFFNFDRLLPEVK